MKKIYCGDCGAKNKTVLLQPIGFEHNGLHECPVCFKRFKLKPETTPSGGFFQRNGVISLNGAFCCDNQPTPLGGFEQNAKRLTK